MSHRGLTVAEQRKALREELPQTMRVIRIDANYINLWGLGDHIYLGCALVEFPDSTPMLLRMSPGGKLEILLTLGEVKTITGNATVSEIVAVLEAPDGTVFCTTHPYPVHILRKRPSDAAFSSVYNDPTMNTSYGMAINNYGDIFATMRGPAVIGGPHRSVLRSQDGGATWTTVWTDANDWLFGIEAFGGHVVAGGDNIIVNSVNRGTTWATTATPGIGFRAVKALEGLLSGAVFADKWVALSSDYYGTYYVSLNGGQAWTLPVNKLAVALASAPNPAAVAPNGELFVLDTYAVRFARTKNLSEWDTSGIIYSGVVARGIYVTDTHIYVSSIVSSGTPYHGQPGNGMVFIIPRSTLEWADIKASFPMHSAVALKLDDTDYSSSPLLCTTAKKFLLEYRITETGTLVDGDRLIIKVEFSDDLTNWHLYQNGPFGYLAEEESTTPCNKCVDGDCVGEYMRVTLRTDYTNADPTANYFTATVKVTTLEN